ncbi:MAG: lytic transglycosylase domain-containing protein [Burkholderiaceae bacterium]|nr:lytic transglycosylase domain-containing protein [Burkholderiaceae bacterium]
MLILAVISVESNFDPRAQSNRGAQGLMQVLTRVHADKFSPFGGVAAAFDPMATSGQRPISERLPRRDGSVEGALKAYVGAALLPSDGGYGAKVIFERERMAAAAAGRPVPAAPVSAAAAASGKGTDAGLAPKPPVSESGAEAARGEFRMVTDSPLLMPPPAPSVDVGAPEAATPAKPIARESSDA